jgi:hypothetical protein
LCRIVHMQVFFRLYPTSFFLHLTSEGVAYSQLEVFIFALGANLVLLDRLVGCTPAWSSSSESPQFFFGLTLMVAASSCMRVGDAGRHKQGVRSKC